MPKILLIAVCVLGAYWVSSPQQSIVADAVENIQRPATGSTGTVNRIPQFQPNHVREAEERVPANWLNSAVPELVKNNISLFSEIHSENKNRNLQTSKLLSWNLKAAGLDEEQILSLISDGEPLAINYFRGGENIVLSGDSPFGTGAGLGKVLRLADEKTIEQVIKLREAVEPKNLARGSSAAPLPENHYELVEFKPGFRDDGVTRVVERKDMSFSIQGPDHNMNVAAPKGRGLDAILQRTVSLGHGGEITLRVKDGGEILNREGSDFAVFENPLKVGENIYFLELAEVGVAKVNEENAYKWFECKSDFNVLQGCAGVVPEELGGDKFDLSSLGVESIRFIKIRDIQTNYSSRKDKDFKIGANTEGFDLDALKLLHAYPKLD